MLYITLAILFILQKMCKLRVGFDICGVAAVIELNRYEKASFQSSFLRKHTGRKTAISNPISEIRGLVLNNLRHLRNQRLKNSVKSVESVAKLFYAKRTQFSSILRQKRRFRQKTKPIQSQFKPNPKPKFTLRSLGEEGRTQFSSLKLMIPITICDI